jgi:hypothetical protein
MAGFGVVMGVLLTNVAGHRWQNAASAKESVPMPDHTDSHGRYQSLREMGSRAHQLRAATRAADHYMAQGVEADRDTGSWLMNTAVTLAAEVAADVDGLARSLKEAPVDAAFAQAVQSLRVRSHQLHAAARAADHFLDQEAHEDRDTGSWLMATARTLAERLAHEIDDGASLLKRSPGDSVIDANEAAVVRRVGAATAPLRGAA